jgi:hypothetical protein
VTCDADPAGLQIPQKQLPWHDLSSRVPERIRTALDKSTGNSEARKNARSGSTGKFINGPAATFGAG